MTIHFRKFPFKWYEINCVETLKNDLDVLVDEEMTRWIEVITLQEHHIFFLFTVQLQNDRSEEEILVTMTSCRCRYVS